MKRSKTREEMIQCPENGKLQYKYLQIDLYEINIKCSAAHCSAPKIQMISDQTNFIRKK